jgi:hypothetical protein
MLHIKIYAAHSVVRIKKIRKKSAFAKFKKTVLQQRSHLIPRLYQLFYYYTLPPLINNFFI